MEVYEELVVDMDVVGTVVMDVKTVYVVVVSGMMEVDVVVDVDALGVMVVNFSVVVVGFMEKVVEEAVVDVDVVGMVVVDVEAV